MIFRESCVSEVSSECVNGEEYPYAPIEYNIRASQITDYTSYVLLDKGLLLIGFVPLHRVICVIHVYVQHTQLGKERKGEPVQCGFITVIYL